MYLLILEENLHHVKFFRLSCPSFSAPQKKNKKMSTTEHAETAERFLPKD